MTDTEEDPSSSSPTITIESGWQHYFDEDEQTRHHVYTGFVVLKIGDQNVILKHNITGDSPQGSPPELEQQIIAWCQQLTNLLAQAQQIEITNETWRWR